MYVGGERAEVCGRDGGVRKGSLIRYLHRDRRIRRKEREEMIRPVVLVGMTEAVAPSGGVKAM